MWFFDTLPYLIYSIADVLQPIPLALWSPCLPEEYSLREAQKTTTTTTYLTWIWSQQKFDPVKPGHMIPCHHRKSLREVRWHKQRWRNKRIGFHMICELSHPPTYPRSTIYLQVARCHINLQVLDHPNTKNPHRHPTDSVHSAIESVTKNNIIH